MSAEVVVAVVAGLALVLSQLPTALASRTARTDLEKDIELYKSLPETTAARENLLLDISARVQGRIDKRSATRYWFGVWLSIVMAGSAIAFGVWFFSTPQWWRVLYAVLVIVLAIFAISGFSVYFPRRHRGVNGQVIPNDTNQPGT